jgi:hypothetical protein
MDLNRQRQVHASLWKSEDLAEVFRYSLQTGSLYTARLYLNIEHAWVGERQIVDDCAVFHADDKLTYVRSQGAAYRVASTLDELEARLDADRFIRSDIGSWVIKLKDCTEWDVARRRVGELKERVGW